MKKIIHTKDKHDISDLTYRSLYSELELNLPTLYSIRKVTAAYDELLDIFENERGVFVDIKQKLQLLIPKIKDGFIYNENVLNIKYSCDGASVIYNKVFLNFTFTILNEGDKAKPASVNYTAGIFDSMGENYSELQFCLGELLAQIDELNVIEIGDEIYEIRKFYAADLKELAIVFGINTANSNQPRIWCKWDKSEYARVIEDEHKLKILIVKNIQSMILKKVHVSIKSLY